MLLIGSQKLRFGPPGATPKLLRRGEVGLKEKGRDVTRFVSKQAYIEVTEAACTTYPLENGWKSMTFIKRVFLTQVLGQSSMSQANSVVVVIAAAAAVVVVIDLVVLVKQVVKNNNSIP